MSDQFTGVQLLAKGENDAFELNKQGLKVILNKAGDTPVAVVSVCGDKRKGKSFILNLFLRFLVEGMPNSSTLRRLFSRKVDLFPSFEWRGGSERNTEGIWIIDKPIIIKTYAGEVALFLMDTQGMFDSQTSKKECSQIFALATIMSSHLVFNLMRQIQANDLECLDFWTQTAKFVNKEEDQAIFQNLLFLIRDFPFRDYGFGIKAGDKYLELELQETSDKTATVNENIHNLRRVFSTVKAFGMPTPDEQVTSRREKDAPVNLNKIGNAFLQHADDLFNYLKTNTAPLLLNGSPMRGSQLYEYIVACCDNLLSDKVPDPYTLSESVAKFQLGKLVAKEKNEYESVMKKTMDSYEGSLIELRKFHEDQLLGALSRFDKVSKFGRDVVIYDYRSMLESDIRDVYEAHANYYEQKLGLEESENRREEESKIAQQREDRLSQLVKMQEKTMKQTAEKHERETQEWKNNLEKHEKRLLEAEERSKRLEEEAREKMDEQRRKFQESENETKRALEAAKAEYKEQQRMVQKMADDNSKQAEEARRDLKSMEDKFHMMEEMRKEQQKDHKKQTELQMAMFREQQEAKTKEAIAAEMELRRLREQMFARECEEKERRRQENEVGIIRTVFRRLW